MAGMESITKEECNRLINGSLSIGYRLDASILSVICINLLAYIKRDLSQSCLTYIEYM